MTVRLSNLQYAMLKIFSDPAPPTSTCRIAEAQAYDQRPFRSMLIRDYVAFKPSRGFHLTANGRKAAHDFHNRNIQRQNPLLPLTRYFDPTAYGLTNGGKE